MAANARLKRGDLVKVVAVPSPGSGGSLPDWQVGDTGEVSHNDVENKNMHVRFHRLKADRLVGWRYVEPYTAAGASGGSSGSQQAPTGSIGGSLRVPKATSSATASPGRSAPSRMTGGMQGNRQHLLESAMRPQASPADRRVGADAHNYGLHHAGQPASAAASGLQCQGGASSGSSASASDAKMECLLKVATSLKQRNSDETDLFRKFSAADRRGEKTLSGDSFRKAISYLDPAVDDKTLRALFADFDRNSDGFIDQQEFRRGLAAAASSPGLADMGMHSGKVGAVEGRAQPVRPTAPMGGVGSTRGAAQWSSMPGGTVAPYGAPRLSAPAGVPKPQDQSPPPNPDLVAHESGSRRRSSSLGRLSPARRPDELVFTSDHGSGRMPALDGGYDWIRRANGEEDRRLRQEAAMTTLAACQRGGYVFDGRQIQLDHVQYMTQQTRIVRASAATAAVSKGAATSGEVSAKLTPYSPGLAIEVACQRAQLNAKVALCSAASAYHAGGGFLDGGRHALEEAICMQSTLYKSLAVAEDLALREGVTVPSNVSRLGRWGEAWRCHIPEDGVILSPLVEVFRDGTASGYPFRDRTAKLTAVISMAMPNRNDRVRDAPVDVPRTWDEYQHILKQKFMAFLYAAVQCGAEELVLPDAGCGVYGNEPNEVGAIFGAVLREHFPSRFREIHLAGQPAFAQAFTQATTEVPAPSAPPLDTVGTSSSRMPAAAAAAAAAPRPRGNEELDVFRKMDLDRNGMISRWELAARLRQMDAKVWTQERVETLLRRGKFNTNGEVAFEEFRKWTQDPKSEWYEVWRTLTAS